MKHLWKLNIVVGLGAFFISAIVEYYIFASITGRPAFSFCITAVLESSKILMIIFHRTISDRKNYKIPDNVSLLNTVFKIGLITLSLGCSIAFISNGMDRPNLDAVRSNDLALITNSFNEKIALVESQREKRLDKITTEIKGKYQGRYQELDSQYLPKIQHKAELRDAEFRNMKGGIRKGPFWKEHDRQLQELEDKYKSEKDALRFAENTELERNIIFIENEFQTKIDDSLSDKEAALTNINTATYNDDVRVKNEIVESFLVTLNQGLGFGISYLSFALIFSLLTSTLLELTIFLTFSYVTIFYNSVLNPAEEEFVYVNQAKPSPEPEAQGVTEGHIEPSMEEFYQDLQNQFQNPGTPAFANPCGQEGG